MNEQLEGVANLTKTDFDGKRAKIIDRGHPWYNAIAECMGAKIMGGAWYMIFKGIESGIEFGVSHGSQVMWIDKVSINSQSK